MSTEAIKALQRMAEELGQPFPAVGDEWAVRAPGKAKKIKVIGYILENGLYQSGQPYASWERRNKGRYTGILVEKLLLWGKRLSTAEERARHFAAQVNAQRARRGKPPL